MCAGNWRRTQDANAPHELGRIGRIWLGFRRYALHKFKRLVACFSRFPWLAMDAIDTNIIHSSCWTVKRKWQVLSHWNGAAVYGCLLLRLLLVIVYCDESEIVSNTKTLKVNPCSYSFIYYSLWFAQISQYWLPYWNLLGGFSLCVYVCMSVFFQRTSPFFLLQFRFFSMVHLTRCLCVSVLVCN